MHRHYRLTGDASASGPGDADAVQDATDAQDATDVQDVQDVSSARDGPAKKQRKRKAKEQPTAAEAPTALELEVIEDALRPLLAFKDLQAKKTDICVRRATFPSDVVSNESVVGWRAQVTAKKVDSKKVCTARDQHHPD